MTESSLLRLSRLVFFLVVWALTAPHLGAQAAPASTPLPFLSTKKASQLIQEQSQPNYPALARVNYIQGHVRVELEVGCDGKVVEAHVTSGHPILAAAALKALRTWTYRPLETSSGPAAFLTTVLVKFSLRTHNTHHTELFPSQAESDLSRQVHPPVVTERPPAPRPAAVIHMRLLVSDKGQVIDSEPSPRAFANPTEAGKALEAWTFLPAHWGSLPIPWYLEVDVPFNASSLPHAVGNPGRR